MAMTPLELSVGREEAFLVFWGSGGAWGPLKPGSQPPLYLLPGLTGAAVIQQDTANTVRTKWYNSFPSIFLEPEWLLFQTGPNFQTVFPVSNYPTLLRGFPTCPLGKGPHSLGAVAPVQEAETPCACLC